MRIPREFELEGDKAVMRREGDRLIIEPVCSGNLLELLRALGPLADTFPDIDDFPVHVDEPDPGA